MMVKFALFGLLLIAGAIHAQNATCANPLQVGTFNTLQISFAPYKDRRLEGAINYLNTVQDLSILCLQELWDVDQRQQVISGLSGRYPTSFYAPAVQTTCNGGCSRDELRRVSECIDDADCSIFRGEFRECVYANCRPQIESVGAGCATCLQAGDSVTDIFRNLDNCFSSDTQQEGICYAYEGQSDNLLLSTQPFDVTDVLYFSESPITLTTALYGRLNTSIGTTHVFCTHLLPADLPVFTFENRTNFNQTVQLLEWVNSKLGNTSDPVIMLGDFNHGPNYWPDNYDYVINNGYISAYTQAGNRNCTYCASNPLAMGSSTMIIDHAYLRNAQQASSSRFATYQDYNLESVNVPFIDYDRVPISDHYGVRASVCASTTPVTGILSSQIPVADTDSIPRRDSSDGEIILISLSLITLATFLTV